MSSKFHRYEASVKLSNGSVVVYHNINTGLFKFHRFLCEKFNGEERWISYSVRRKANKEIVGKYRNSIPGKTQTLVTIFTETRRNNNGTGVYVPIIFNYNGERIVRNMFVANKVILQRNSLLITIPEWLFTKLIENGRQELYAYYLEKKCEIKLSEITPGEMYHTRESRYINEIPETKPESDYP